MSQKRQLAAIMFTDIVGYTALMGQDEPKALEILRKSRQIQRTAVEGQLGEWLKEMGDGVLARFDSAVSAVKCALQIQQNAADLGAFIRIGIHLGDVSLEGGDVFGDGVNVASRIQSIADPGGIYISGNMHQAIRAHTDISTKYLGEVSLKNVSIPVGIYAVEADFLPKASRKRLGTSRRPKVLAFLVALVMILMLGYAFRNALVPRKALSSAVILPIENRSGIAELDVYSEAILDAIINEVGKIRQIRVPSTRTSLAYREQSKSLPQIAEELDVEAAIELSLLGVGDSMHLRVKLYEIEPNERAVWNGEFSRDVEHVYTMYADIAYEIAKHLNPSIPEQSEFQLASNREVIPQAYEMYVRGMSHWYKLTPEDLDQALRYFELATEIDPDYAMAYSGVAMVWGGRMQQGILPESEAGPKVDSALNYALSLDSSLVEVHYTLALFNTWWRWDFERAAVEFLKTLELNPNHAGARAYYSHYLNMVGRPEEAMLQINMALELDPYNPLFQALYAMDLNYARRFDEAIEKMNETLELSPRDPVALSTLRSAYHMVGNEEMAYQTFVRSYAVFNSDEEVRALERGYADGGYRQALISLAEWLIEQSQTSFVTPWRIATLYARANEKALALEYLQKAFDAHDVNMPYIQIDPIFDHLREEPKFIELIEKMNFPS